VGWFNPANRLEKLGSTFELSIAQCDSGVNFFTTSS
jgi:hypothetical protein